VVQSLVQHPADSEERSCPLIHRYFRASSWIAPNPCAAASQGEGAEATEFPPLSVRQSAGNIIEDRLEISSTSARRKCGLLAERSAMRSALVMVSDTRARESL
jgi:hypothetical protein